MTIKGIYEERRKKSGLVRDDLSALAWPARLCSHACVPCARARTAQHVPENGCGAWWVLAIYGETVTELPCAASSLM